MSAAHRHPVPVFDGHNDTLLELPSSGRSFFERSETGHVDLPRAREGGMAGGMFAVFIPDPEEAQVAPEEPEDEDGAVPDPAARLGAATYRYGDHATMPPQMSLERAQREALRMIARLFRLERESAGQAKVVRTAAEIRQCLDDGVLAMELHMEGAEPIDEDLDALGVFHAAGLRSLGITWSRPNRFGTGVPFAFPSTGDVGPGLTDLGVALVRACNELGIMVDCSHLNEAGFWDVVKHSQAPVVCTHSNVHAICPSARNLTDRQLDAIRDSDGLVGLNFHVGFLHPDGRRDPELDLGVMCDHVDALVDRLGPTRVAFGSDFDGATMPAAIRDASGLQALVDALRGRGYDDDTLHALGHGNWIRVLGMTWAA